MALFFRLVRAWADLAMPACEEAPRGDRACPLQPCRTTVLPVLWGSPRSHRQPGTSVPTGSRDQATAPQWQRSLSGDKECCLSSFPRQARPGLARWPRTVSWGWEWYPRLPQGDLAGQGQSPSWGGLLVPSVPGIPAVWSLGTWVQEPWVWGGQQSGPQLACVLLTAEWAAVPLQPRPEAAPGEIILLWPQE